PPSPLSQGSGSPRVRPPPRRSRGLRSPRPPIAPARSVPFARARSEMPRDSLRESRSPRSQRAAANAPDPTAGRAAQVSGVVRWLAGDAARRAEIEDAIARLARGEGVEWLRQRDRRRRLARIGLPGGRACFAKHYLARDRHAWRDAGKERLGLAAARREWRTLASLRAAGLPVPAPLAHALLASGEHVLVTEWIEAVPLAEALADRARRRELLAAVGAVVRALHEAGWVHRDLHRANLLIAGGAPVLRDLQAARRARGAAARLRDLGRLDHSLRRLLSRGDRVRLRAAALGLPRPLDAAGREAVRAAGAASLLRARAHANSRARRSLRAGRRAQRFEFEGGRGLVSRAFDPAPVAPVPPPPPSP